MGWGAIRFGLIRWGSMIGSKRPARHRVGGRPVSRRSRDLASTRPETDGEEQEMRARKLWKLKASRVGAVACLALWGGVTGALAAPSAQSIGALCDGRPASHPWLDASGQTGPTLINGTDGDDVIIGGEGNDNIDGMGGDDVICGMGGDDSPTGGDGNDVLDGGPGNDGLDAGPGRDTLYGGPGDDNFDPGPGHDFISAGPGDDWIKANDDDEVDKADGGEGFDVCFFSPGDELANCEY
jgi:hypothetical protein